MSMYGYKIKVEIYKNAVNIMVYKYGCFVGDNVIKIRWWQRKKAAEIVDEFIIDNISELHRKGIDYEVMDYDDTID